MFFIMAAINFSGCSSIGFSDTELMRPPKATGEKAAIQNAIESIAGGEYTLKYPQNGDYRSAIITEDLTQSGIEEVVVFYRTAGENTSTSISFISEVDGEFRVTKSFKNQNSDIDRVLIGDIDNDGAKEVVVGWTSFIQGANQVTYYKVTKSDVVENAIDDKYSELVMCDMTADGVDDLMLFSLTNPVSNEQNNNKARATLYSYANNEFRKISEVNTNPSVKAYSRVQYGKISDDLNGIFLDCQTVQSVNENEMITEVVYYDTGVNRLKNPLNIKSDDLTIENATLRKSASVSRDIDLDEILEVPSAINLKYPDFEITEKETLCDITCWSKLDVITNWLIPVEYSVANFADGYYFILPRSWHGNIAATNNTELRTIKFYLHTSQNTVEVQTKADDNTKATQEEIEVDVTQADEEYKLALTIQVFAEQDWNNNQITHIGEGYTELTTEAGFVYAAKLSAEDLNEFAISMSDVIANFRLIN